MARQMTATQTVTRDNSISAKKGKASKGSKGKASGSKFSDSDSTPKKPKAESLENLTAVYFKELASLAVLKPEQEFKAARMIEDQELKLWAHVLSYPQLLEFVLTVVSRNMENTPQQLGGLVKKARALRKQSSSARRSSYVTACEESSRCIHVLDLDRRALTAVIVELRRVSRGERLWFGSARIPVKVQSQRFKDYYRTMRALLARAQRTRNEFIKANLRLVVSIARRFNHGRMPLNDLIQEGNIGLIKAVERYDYRRGYRFSTYASWWIRHSISRALADKGRAVRLPVHMLDAHQRVNRATKELSTKLGRPPTIEEIGCCVGLTKEKVEKIQGYVPDQALSLDRSVSDDDDRRFVEMLHDPDAVTPTDKLVVESVSLQVRDIFSDLKPIEADVLNKRFGLRGDEEQTLKVIGEGYELSRERIRQIQEQALGKIRRALKRRNAV